MTAKKKPPFTRADFHKESLVLHAASVLMDGRTTRAKLYRKLSVMLAFADIHLPKTKGSRR